MASKERDWPAMNLIRSTLGGGDHLLNAVEDTPILVVKKALALPFKFEVAAYFLSCLKRETLPFLCPGRIYLVNRGFRFTVPTRLPSFILLLFFWVPTDPFRRPLPFRTPTPT